MKKWIIFILAVLLSLALLPGCSDDRYFKGHVTGLVNATEIDVASKVPGRVKELYVREGDAVNEGDKLVLLEGDIIEAKLDQVNAAVDAANAQLKMAKKGAREEEKRATRRQLDAARHQVEITEKMYNRLKKLYEQKAIPKAKFDEAEFKYNVSKEQEAMAKAKYDAVMKGARDEQIEALEALVNKGQGALAEVQSYNKETTQYSPIDGEISKIILNKGELASTGYPIVTVVNLKDIWASFSVREDLLKDIKKGQQIEAYLPALNKKVTLEIYHIAALGDFATWKATSDRGGFDLKSFEIKAKFVDAIEGLRPGMTIRWDVED